MKLWSILNPHGYDLAPSAPSSAPTLMQNLPFARTRSSLSSLIESGLRRAVVFIAVDSERTAEEVLPPG
jgi:hypothetical protein